MARSSDNGDQRVAFGTRILALSQEIREGNSAAEKELMAELYSSPLIMTALATRLRAIIPGHLDPEDVALQVFDNVLRAIAKEQLPDSPDVVLAWVRRVFINAALTVRRRPAHQLQTVEIDSSDAQHQQLDRVLATPLPNAETQAVSRQAIGQAERCVDSLPERQQATLLLHLNGQKYKEIAEDLGITTSTAGVTLRNARKTFFDCMNEHGFDIAV